jgi:hypothetical protein
MLTCGFRAPQQGCWWHFWFVDARPRDPDRPELPPEWFYVNFLRGTIRLPSLQIRKLVCLECEVGQGDLDWLDQEVLLPPRFGPI